MAPFYHTRFPIQSLMPLILALGLSLPGWNHAAAQMELGLDKDSLRLSLQTMPADTAKVHALIRLGQQYESNIPDSALYYYQQARQLSERLHFPAGFVRFVSNYTAVLNVQGRFDESLKLNLAAIDTCKKYGLRHQYIQALGNTGAVYQYKEDYRTAADYYLQALPVVETEGDLQGLSFLCGNLCGLYRNLRQTEKARVYALRALQYAEKNKDPVTIGSACNNLGNVLKDLGRIDESIAYIDRAYRTGGLLSDDNMQETALINLGDAYTKKYEYAKSIAYFRRAVPLAVALGDISGQAFALQGIAIGLFHQKAFGPARRQLTRTIVFARQHDQKEVLGNTLLLMSDVLIAAGDLDSARRYRDEYDSVTGSLLNASMLKNVQELEMKYDVEKKRREVLQKDLLLEQKGRETLRQRTLLYLSTAGTGVLVLLLFLGYRAYRQRQQLNLKEMQALRSGQENIRLKAQLDGQLQERQRISQEIHDDIGSGLTSLVFLSRSIEDAGGIAGKIRANAEDLTKKMNEIIWTMNHEEDTLDSLVSYIRANVAEALDTAGIGYRFQVTDPVPVMHISQELRRNVYLVLKEAVHNVIRHANAASVVISFIIDRQLEITVQDDGKGFDGGEDRRFGNGLKNMRRRTKNIDGELTIESREGTRLRLIVPLPV